MEVVKPEIIQLSDNPNDRIIIVKKIGQGGFGSISKAKWKGVDLAIKRAKKTHGGQSIKTEVAVLKEYQGIVTIFLLNL